MIALGPPGQPRTIALLSGQLIRNLKSLCSSFLLSFIAAYFKVSHRHFEEEVLFYQIYLAIPVLGIYPIEIHTHVANTIWSKIFIAVIFLEVKKEKKNTCCSKVQ